jgi:hypothetical protein
MSISLCKIKFLNLKKILEISSINHELFEYLCKTTIISEFNYKKRISMMLNDKISTFAIDIYLKVLFLKFIFK